MAANVVWVVATLVAAYVLGHLIAVAQARRRDLNRPAFFDYTSHRALWSEGIEGYRRDPWYWGILVVAIVIVNLLTKRSSVGVGFAAAVAFGFLAGGVYRSVRARESRSS
ncbi:MAG TPA: hypothetical protein VIK04_18895 [Solirubrobacteraceae bacterium]